MNMCFHQNIFSALIQKLTPEVAYISYGTAIILVFVVLFQRRMFVKINTVLHTNK